MTDVATSTSLITGTTYNPANQLLTMSGYLIENRTYNSMLQLTRLQSSYSFDPAPVDITYNYSATQNNGKITSQTDNLSGEQVVYTYDSLNRLASAQATSSSWGQSYTYDGFGNLTDQTVIAGTAPAYHVVYDASKNRISGEAADANGNIGSGVFGGYAYDVSNRIVGAPGNYQYAYAPGNKRVWRAVWTSSVLTTDEVTFWSVAGQRLGTYSIAATPYVISPMAQPTMTITQATTNYYFGGKLLKHADRLGSVGKYYPYGLEKPSATTNGTESSPATSGTPNPASTTPTNAITNRGKVGS
jgi:YD repeat-containing protein